MKDRAKINMLQGDLVIDSSKYLFYNYLNKYKGDKMRKSNELQIGKAGEYIVCADLIIKGLIAYPSEQGLPYDVVIDNGIRLLKCQVKTTEGPRKIPQRNRETLAYIFNIKRHGKNNKQRYLPKEIDLFALVCLDTKMVGYLLNKDMPDTINIRVDSLKGRYYDEKGIEDFKKVIELKKQGFNQTTISEILKIGQSTVNRMCQEGYKPHQTNARYFSDFEKDKEWFRLL
jgi:hypothetical protein